MSVLKKEEQDKQRRTLYGWGVTNVNSLGSNEFLHGLGGGYSGYESQSPGINFMGVMLYILMGISFAEFVIIVLLIVFRR